SPSVRSVAPIAVALETKVIAVRPTRVEKGRLPCGFGLQAPSPAVDLIPTSAGAAATVLGAVSSAPHTQRATTMVGGLRAIGHTAPRLTLAPVCPRSPSRRGRWGRQLVTVRR